jgi:hypothetical protein
MFPDSWWTRQVHVLSSVRTANESGRRLEQLSHPTTCDFNHDLDRVFA